MAATGTSGRVGRVGRVGAWMGIAFSVLFVVGEFIQPSPKDMKDVNEWAQLWNSSSNRTKQILGAYLVVVGLLAFIWFASKLRSALGDGAGMMLTFGSVFAAMGMVGTLIATTIAGNKAFASAPVPSGSFSQQLNGVGAGILVVPGALAAGVFVAIASYLARRNSVLPGWLTIFGYAVAVLQVVAVVFIPLLLVPIWVLITSIVLLRREAGTAAAA